MRTSLAFFPGLAVLVLLVGCRHEPQPDDSADTGDSADSGETGDSALDTGDTSTDTGDTSTDTGDTSTDTGDTADTGDTGDTGVEGDYEGTLSLGVRVSDLVGELETHTASCGADIDVTFDPQTSPDLSFDVDCPMSGDFTLALHVTISGELTGESTLEGTWETNTPFGQGTWTGEIPRQDRVRGDLTGAYNAGGAYYTWTGSFEASRR